MKELSLGTQWVRAGQQGGKDKLEAVIMMLKPTGL